jgi:integrase
VRAALLNYLLERKPWRLCPPRERAVPFDSEEAHHCPRSRESGKKIRGNLRAIEKISPHKLRSTYGTMLYQETGDIYLVADVLGHKDVNTTRKHYAAISQDRRRIAAQVIKLREDTEKPNDDGN